ncbi:MAG: hypothetical protein QOF83_3593 [Solirubrobacteraceae bacterium]|jgi:hypothetical protein|nr:hypothetical protein [Solirubrobacteraceae bacterium]
MSLPDSSAHKFNIQIGTVSESQVAVGDYNTISQRIGLTPAETAQLQSLFQDLRSSVSAQAPPAVQADAETRVRELEDALVAGEPDPGTVRRVLRWFKANAPQLAGAVVSVVINPLVGKVVEGAGTAMAERIQQAIAEES